MPGLLKHLRIIPTSLSKTPRRLDIWFRVFQSQTIMYKCNDLLLSEADIPPQYHPDIVASNDDHDPVEGDANC
jgi:hypothetical protein